MRNIRNIEQNNPVNRDLNNVVDKDVQAMLRPLNMTQFISFSPKYCIKNNCITPNGFLFNVFSVIGALIFMSIYFFRTYMVFQYRDLLDLPELSDTSMFHCIYYCAGFATNTIIGIIQTKNNIKFVLLFQRVHRLLNDETSFNRFIIWNWITVIMAFSCNFIIFAYHNIQLPLPWFYLLVGYLFVVFDFNMVYATRQMKLLESKLELWNFNVLNSIDTEDMRGGDFSKRMFQAYVDLMECYDILKLCCQPLILFYIIEVFLHSFMYIEEAIHIMQVGLRKNKIRASSQELLAILSWLVKDLTWQTMFMQRCDTFYLAVQNVRDSCALTLKSNCSDDEKKLYKNVLRLHRASFSKMRVCGLFYADAALQLSLMSLLANYTIVLLQFAFL